MRNKVTERIIERVPAGVSLQIQSLSEQVFDNVEFIVELEKENDELKKDIKQHDKIVASLHREIIDLNKKLKRIQSDFNQSESNHFKLKRRIEQARQL